MSEFRLRLKQILLSMRDKVVTPGDVVSFTGLPRYEVLATFHVLEALKLIELVNAKGNYRVYKLSELGEKLLEALEKEYEILLKFEGSTPQSEVSSEASA